jgi:hypothetical protein
MQDTIKINLMGGLGNNFFQLNYAYNLKDQGYKVLINTFLLERNFITKLLKWSIHNSLNDLHNLNLLNGFLVKNNFSFSIFFALLSKLFDKKIFGVKFSRHNVPDSLCSIKELFGYFQLNNPVNIKFLKNIKKGLNSYIYNNCNILSNIDLLLPVIHIRGGDYLSIDKGNFSYNYPFGLLSKFKKFNVVTNDIDYAKELLSDFKSNYVLITNSTVLCDFYLLYISNEKILANSTFSWWAAELNNCATVYEPSIYFNNIEWFPLSNIVRRKFSSDF